MKTGCIYVRTATIDERYKNVSKQISLLMNLALKRKINIKQIFIDAGVSGCQKSKPQLERMLNYICDQEVDYVLVRDIERISMKYKEVYDFINYSFVQLITTQGVVRESELKTLIHIQELLN